MEVKAPTHATHGEFLIDTIAVGAVSLAVCLVADRPALMSLVVGTAVPARFLALARFPVECRTFPIRMEIAVFAACAIIGAANDWNTVVRHHVYRYDVGDLVPFETGIPLWMMVFWGLILRYLITFFRWSAQGTPAGTRHALYLGWKVIQRPGAKIAIELILIFATRQAIYRTYDHPVFSWLPFAIALGLHGLLFRWDRSELKVIATLAVAGPIMEILFIHVGGLHHYDLGWLGGVPLWIMLWWVLAGLIMRDLWGRIHPFIHERKGGSEKWCRMQEVRN